MQCFLLQYPCFIIDFLSDASLQLMFNLALYLTEQMDDNRLSFHSYKTEISMLKEMQEVSCAAGSCSPLVLQGLWQPRSAVIRTCFTLDGLVLHISTHPSQLHGKPACSPSIYSPGEYFSELEHRPNVIYRQQLYFTKDLIYVELHTCRRAP